MHITLTPEEQDALRRCPELLDYAIFSAEANGGVPAHMSLRVLLRILASEGFARNLRTVNPMASIDVEQVPPGRPDIVRCETRKEAVKRRREMATAAHYRRVRQGQVTYEVFAWPEPDFRLTWIAAVADDGQCELLRPVDSAMYHEFVDPELLDAEIAKALTQEIQYRDREAALQGDPVEAWRQ